ncbi:uncharacterized protein [Eucyclogobius newberryi]|uniref:uncharacterized protein n=1 Tax=Eucyclogobius newberryi TaxID=166745 RepID=UPI003B5CB7CE
MGYQHKDCDLEGVHKAAAEGDLDKLKELVTKKKTAINRLHKIHGTALHIACAVGYDQVVQFLVDRNANLKCRDDQGQTALMKAVQGNHQTCVSILLKNCADSKIPDFEGNTALHMAASISIARQLLNHGANINSHTNSLTPLIVAVCKDNIEMARFLLKGGANVNGTDHDKKSPLMFAAEKGQSSMLKLLLQHDADTSLQDLSGWSAVEYAMNNGHYSCGDLIKQAKHKDDAVYLDHGENGEERSIAFQREAPSQTEWDFTDTPSSSEVYEVEENREEEEDAKDQNEEQKEHLEDEVYGATQQHTKKKLLRHELSKPEWDTTNIFSEVFEQLNENIVLPKEVAKVYGEGRAISSQSEEWDSPEEEYNEEKEDHMSPEGQGRDPKDKNEEQESLEDEVHRVIPQQKEKDLQMDVLQKEEMLTAQVKEHDRALQKKLATERDRVLVAEKKLATERERALQTQKELAKVQHEATQEQLAKAQSKQRYQARVEEQQLLKIERQIVEKTKVADALLEQEMTGRSQTEVHKLHREETDLLQGSLQNRQRTEHELRTQMEAPQRECRQVKERARQELQTTMSQEGKQKMESLENEVHRVTQQLKEKELQMDVLRKEREVLTAQVKEQDRALLAQKEALQAQKVQHEATQERLAKAQSECQLLQQQQLKEVNDKRVTQKVVTDTQQCFSHRLSKLPSDCEERVQLVEERNKELLSKATELQDKVCMLEDEKNKREVSMRQLQQELSETQENLSKMKASQEVNTQYCNDLEKEKTRILRNMDGLKEKLADSENQRVQAEKGYQALKREAEQQSLKIEAMEKAAQECYVVMVRGHPEELFSNLQNRTISLEDQLSSEEPKQNTVSLLAQDYKALWEKEVKSCSELGLQVSELEKEKRKFTLHNEIVKKESEKIVEKKKVADALLEREKTRNLVLQTEVRRLHTLVKTDKNKLCDKEMGGEKMRGDVGLDLQKMKDLQVQLDKETVWRCQLENDNCDLHKKLMSLQCSLENRQRTEYELRTQMEATQRECRQVKESAKQEFLTKLEQVNQFLQIRNASQEALDSQQDQRIRKMESEVSRARFSEQECLSRLDSHRMELDWYKTKYSEEKRLRQSLVSKLQRADSHHFEANACVRMSTLFSA